MAVKCKRCNDAEGGCQWCVLPDSLKPIKDRWAPCTMCGKRTPGTRATLPRLQADGSLIPAPHLCAECDGRSSKNRAKEAFDRERKSESYKASWGR